MTRQRQRVSRADRSGTRPRQLPPATKPSAPTTARPGPEPLRNRALDGLRGLAIGLMVVDHVAQILFLVPLDSEIRFVTRLAEPLFAVTFGVLLVTSNRRRALRRLPRIVLAALLVNALFFPAYQVFEILVTFSAVLALYLGLGRHLMLLAPLVLIERWDPSGALFDYPLLLVASQVALGMLLRQRRAPLFMALYLATALIPGGETQRIAFTSLAALAVWFALRHPKLRLAGFEWLGLHPLKVYVAQFLVIFGIAGVLDVSSVDGIKAFYGNNPRAAVDRERGVSNVQPPDPALPCLGTWLPLVRVRDLPIVDLAVARAHGRFVIDFATTASTLDPRQLEGTRPLPLPGTTDRYERISFFGRWPGARFELVDLASFARDDRRAGLIGTDFLANGAITIDWVQARLYRADAADFCAPDQLLAAGLQPLSTAGYYARDPRRLNHPNVPTIPIRIGDALAPAQIDTAFDDRMVRHSLNVNRAYLDAIRSSGLALVRAPELDLELTACTGSPLRMEAYRLPPASAVELVGENGAAVRRIADAVLFLKPDSASTHRCGGIGTWDTPAAQLGVSFMADAGRLVVDPDGARVWLPADPAPSAAPAKESP